MGWEEQGIGIGEILNSNVLRTIWGLTRLPGHMVVLTEVGHPWSAVVPILRVMFFPALVQECTRLVELL